MFMLEWKQRTTGSSLDVRQLLWAVASAQILTLFAVYLDRGEITDDRSWLQERAFFFFDEIKNVH